MPKRHLQKSGWKNVRHTGRMLGKPLKEPAKKTVYTNPFTNQAFRYLQENNFGNAKPIQLTPQLHKELSEILRIRAPSLLELRMLESTYPGTSTPLREFIIGVRPLPKMKADQNKPVFLRVQMFISGGAAIRTIEYVGIEESLAKARIIKS